MFAQKPDSLNTETKNAPIVSYQHEQDYFPIRSSYKMMDTNFYGVHRYFPNNFPYSLYLSSQRLSYRTSPSIGFTTGTELYNLFGYSRNDIKYFNTRAPFTSILLVFGQKKEQYSQIQHTQNITKQWNIALNMLRIRSEGFYNRQNCVDNNISLATHYTTRNNRYTVLANGIISSIKTDENGGITNDTLFEATLKSFLNKKLLQVNLAGASSRRKNKEVTVTQFLNFGKRIEYKINDSTSIKKVQPAHYFSYSFHADGITYLYTDKAPFTYYKNIFFDSLATHDSTHVLNAENTFTWNTYLAKNIFSRLSLDQKTSRLVQYSTDSIIATDTLIRNNTIGFNMGNSLADTGQKFIWNIGIRYIFKGPNEKENIFFGKMAYYFNLNRKVSVDIMNKNYSPNFIYTNYSSNHFKWKNAFNDIAETHATVSFTDSKGKLSLGMGYTSITGYVYLDSTCSPKQDNSSISLLTAVIAKHFRLGKFNLDNKITFQNISNTTIVRLPKIFSFHSFYFQDRWFKKATIVQLGFDINYFSSYHANAYMPSLGLYYLQNKIQIGNYPFIDFFFVMKVKRAKVFFKTEHINSGLMKPYYLAPHLPAPDRCIKLGINWDFFD